MNDDDLVKFSVEARNLPERLRWADGLNISLPTALLSTLSGAGRNDAITTGRDAMDAAHNLRLHAAYTPRPPASSRLPLSYRRVPGPARRLIAGIIGRYQRSREHQWSRFPGWPVDLSADFAADLAGHSGITFAQTPVLVTHDIDSPEGLRNLVSKFLPVEESVGARSTNYIVPCGWPLEHRLIEETVRRGHEVGVHGYDHANRTAFADTAERRRRLLGGHCFATRYGAIGYRAPSLLRTAPLIEDLGMFYQYESSIPTSGGPFPVPNNGCATARPWRIGSLWEIPLTLPRDGSLRFLGYSATEIEGIWRDISAIISRSGGIVCILTHCEHGFSGNGEMLAAYRRLLEWFAKDTRFVFRRIADVVVSLRNSYAKLD